MAPAAAALVALAGAALALLPGAEGGPRAEAKKLARLRSPRLQLRPGQEGSCWFHAQLPEMLDQAMFWLLGGRIDYASCRAYKAVPWSLDHSVECGCVAPSSPEAFNLSFVEAGAADGLSLSSTLFFESQLGWRGLCVEASPEQHRQLSRNRPLCASRLAAIGGGSGGGEPLKFYSFLGGQSWSELQSCLQSTKGPAQCRNDEAARTFAAAHEAELRIDEVPVRRLDDLVRDAGLHRLAWLVLDVEGAELAALQSMEFGSIPTRFLAVEGNLTAVRRHLARAGFRTFPSPPLAAAAGLPVIAQLDTWFARAKDADEARRRDWAAALASFGPARPPSLGYV